MKILICNSGCDDTTETELEVNEEELKTLIRFAKENNKNSSYQCMPTIEIYTDYEIKDGYYIPKWETDLVKEEQ